MNELLMESPVGWLLLSVDANTLVGIDFLTTAQASRSSVSHSTSHAVLRQAQQELHEYFANKRKTFDVSLTFTTGTPFQQRVWRALQQIPWGESRNYAELARAAGNSRAYRAAGSANGKNPLPIIVPCHRVVATDGGIGGYSGGLEKKKILLTLEGHYGAGKP